MGEWVCVAGLFYYSIYPISQDPSLCVCLHADEWHDTVGVFLNPYLIIWSDRTERARA